MKMGAMSGAGSAQDSSLKGIMVTGEYGETSGFDNIWVASTFSCEAIT